MGSSLFAGISGLASSGKQLDVIANNIANVNTVGFKAGKIHFGDILSQSVTGGAAAGMQVGRGVDVAAITTQFSSGSFETTGNATDLAIDGDGFFIVKGGDDALYYTRAGAFHLDSTGHLVDVNSFKVQGYNLTTSIDTISDINLSGVMSDPKATAEIRIGANLNAVEAAGYTFNASQTVYDSLGDIHSLKLTFQKTGGAGYWGFQSYLDNDKATSQEYSGLKFDTNGVLVGVYKALPTGTATEGYYATTNAGEAEITINNQGQLYKNTTSEIILKMGANDATWTIDGNNGGYTALSVTTGTDADDNRTVLLDMDGAGGTDITFTLDQTTDVWNTNDTIEFSITQTETTPLLPDVNLTMPDITDATGAIIATIGDADGNVVWDLAGTTAEEITGYASTSVIRTLVHDGRSSGDLKSLSVRQDGTISGFFTNGQTDDIARIVLATFESTEGLKRMGKNLFGQTVASGNAAPGEPGSAGMGEISPNSLEMSNTDIATEFINMITAQRAYQASAKIVTVTDQMMAELMNIKR